MFRHLLMKRRATLLQALIVTVVATASIPVTAPNLHAKTTGEACQGNACNDVSFVFSGGCYRITNHGTQRVRVHMGPISFGLERGQTHVLANPGGGGCLPAFVGSVRANYI